MNVSRALLFLLLAGCRIYDPKPLDCRITCSQDGACPVDTTCVEGFCRLPGALGACECREGDERPCGGNLGVCRPGVQHCMGTQWGVCEGAVGASVETCNGLDDDCDGEVDNGIPLAPPCAKIFGVCFDSKPRCVGGVWLACEASSYGPNYEEDETRCDGLDNDCDGQVDTRGVVELANGAVGPWFLLTTSAGFALVDSTDTAVELRWLTRTLQPDAMRMTAAPGGDFLATTVGETIVLVASTDAGVVIDSFERDGGSATRLVDAWLSPSALDVSAGLAAASVSGEVQILSLLDGGVPRLVGLDTEGRVRLSQTGATLAWSGGLTRTRDLVLLRSGSPGPLLALLDLDSSVLAGVPAGQTGSPVFIPDLASGNTAVSLNPLGTPLLTGLQATEHLGRVLVAGIEGPDGLWLLDERGRQRRQIAPGLESLRLTPSLEPFAAFAWQHGSTVWGVRRCAP